MTTNVIGALDFDADPARWHVVIDGWDSTSQGDYRPTQRFQSDGAFNDRNDATAKDMTLRGSVTVASPELLEAALDRLKTNATRADTTLSRTKFGRTLSMTVKRIGDVDIPPIPTPLTRFFTVQLIAPDPFKYGAPYVPTAIGLPSSGGGLAFPLFDITGKLEFGAPGNSGQVTLLNAGTVDAFPVFTITGPVLGGITLSDTATGRRIVYAGDVPSGATLLIIDSADGTASLNGADRTTELLLKQWWPVPAGGSSTVQFATQGAGGQTGTLSASVTPAYA